MIKCPLHNRELKVGAGGSLYCPTPIAKDAFGKVTKWCQFKPEPELISETLNTTSLPTPASPNVDLPVRIDNSFRESDTQLQIVRQSCISSMAKVLAGHPMCIDFDAAQLAEEIIKGADILVDFVENGVKKDE